MAYQEFTTLDQRVWLELFNWSVDAHSQGTGFFGMWERASGIGYTDETLLEFDVSDLLMSTITNVDLEITCNTDGSQTSGATGKLFEQDKTSPEDYSSIPRFDDFAQTAWGTTLATLANMQNTGTYTFLNTTELKALVQAWLDKRESANWGFVVGIEYESASWYLSLDAAKLKVTYTPPAYPVWGTKYVGFASTNIAWCRMMGGTSPNPANIIRIKSISVYCTNFHSEQLRIAVYQGGALDNPTGATLKWDAGLTSGSGTHEWLKITAPGDGVNVDKNAVTWLSMKANGSGFEINNTNKSAKSGDMQSVRGRYNSTGISTDESVAYPSTIPSGGTFASFWYPIVIQYEEYVEGELPIMRRRKQLIQSL